jgi:uncharacterized membrane protein YedE/YeeE
MKLFWMTLSGICIVAAAWLLASGRLDAAFVTAAIGIVAWFLNYRIQMKEIIAKGNIQSGNKGEDLDGE